MGEFAHILGGLEPWVHEYGALAVFVILTLESFGLPLPGESLLIVAAVLAGRGDISVYALLLCAWAGAVIGDNIGYMIGRTFGHELVIRYGGKVGLSAERMQKIETVFARFGPLTVGGARFFNILRQLNGIVAGTLEMDWKRFLFFNAAGGAIWVSVWVTAGIYLGEHGTDIKALANKIGILGAVLIFVGLIAILGYLRWTRTSAHRRQSLSTEPEK